MRYLNFFLTGWDNFSCLWDKPFKFIRPVSVVAFLATTLTGCGVEPDWRNRVPQGLGPFKLINQHGATVTNLNLLGRPTVFLFGAIQHRAVANQSVDNILEVAKVLGFSGEQGYPRGIREITRVSEILSIFGFDAWRINVVFITERPTMDTPAALKAFLANYNQNIIALTGSPEAVQSVLQTHPRNFYDGRGLCLYQTYFPFLVDEYGRYLGIFDVSQPIRTSAELLWRLATGEKGSFMSALLTPSLAVPSASVLLQHLDEKEK